MSRVTAWYVSHGTGTPARGPFSTDLVRAMLRDGQLNAMDLVYREGESEWRPASMFAELRNVANSSVSSSQHPVEDEQRESQDDLPDTPVPHVQNYSSRSIEEADISWIVLRPHSSTYLQEGPFKTNYIREGLKKGTFQFSQYAWHVGMKQWMRIGDLREFDRRSSPRESAPHVPPPLPDPISAVLLEDDGDFESEEFHVNLKPSKYDATPTDPAIIFSSTKDTVAVGGAAATHFESNGQDLARVPWEERIPASGDHSGVFAQAVELIDDESSFAGFPQEAETATEPDNFQVQPESDMAEVRSRDDFTPQPFVPPPANVSVSNRPKDNWEKWGRYVAAVGMGAITAVFSGHLIAYENPTDAVQVRRTLERASAQGNAGLNTSLEAHPAPTPAQAASETVPPSIAAEAPVAPVKTAEAPVASIDMDDPMAGPEGGLPVAPLGGAAGGAVDSVKSSTQGVATPSAPPQAVASGSSASNPATQVRTTAASSTGEASIVGLKLSSPDAQVLLQGAFPVGQPIEVTFRGRLGEVLAKLHVRKTITITKSGGEIPSIRLKDVGLPDGAYTVEVSSAAIQLKSDIFIGKRDARFLDKLEAHLREKSFELQAQKKVLFYAAQELDSLARDLGLNYGQLRSKPEMWSKFYSKWKTKVSAVERSIAEVSKRSLEDQAYPEETLRLSSLLGTLKETSQLFEQGVGSQRDVASDSLADLISELTRQKEAIGSATSRAAPAAGKGASPGATSKAL